MFSRFVIVAMALIVCPVSAQATELTVNGGFETGDFTGWSLFPSAPGNITIQAPGFTSAFAGCIDNMVLASSSLIKNANIGVGTVVPGGTVTISFDARGATAVGGVVFAEFFSEIAGGGTSASEILGGGPLALDPDPNAWKNFSFTTTTGSDVSGGVTLQLAAITGGATGSMTMVCFDNASVTFTPQGPPTIDLAVNGDFETGDFTGWNLFPSAPGNITIQTPGLNSAFAGCIDNMVVASSSLIKNENIGIGTVMPGQSIMISFDARGATASGGVVFAEFFSEIAGGGTSQSGILGGAPLALDPDPNVWTNFSFTTTTGPDVSGGVTLQLAAITGAAAGSTSMVCFDNVSVNIPAPSATYPGSGEDVALATGVNAAPDMVDVKTAAGGDFLSVNVASPSSTFDLSPFVLLVQANPTSGGVGNLGSSGFPEVYLTSGSPFTIIIDPALPGPIGGSVIGPGSGTTLYFSLPLSLNGLGQSLVFQSFVLSGTAANGLFAASDAHEIIVP